MGLKLVHSQEPNKPYTFEELAEAIQSDRIAETVSDQITVETGIPDYDLSKIPIIDIGFPKKSDPEYGVCAVIPIGRKQERREPLLVDANFPSFLYSQTDMGRQQSLNTAAVFARSLYVVNRAFNVATRSSDASRMLFTKSEIDRYWESEIQHSRQRRIYRAAGTIAVRSLDLDFDTAKKPPYAPHIAGLMNPLPSAKGNSIKGTFRELHEMLHYIHK